MSKRCVLSLQLSLLNVTVVAVASFVDQCSWQMFAYYNVRQTTR
jgi:hypothetical protein